MPLWLFRVEICLLYVVVFLIYWPGLGGPFLFDDYPNLSQMAAIGGVKDWPSFQAFVLGGFSGPTGRPISLFSFLLNATSWPADPYTFKVFNVLIHIVNSILIYLITRTFLKVALPSGSTNTINDRCLSLLALLCAAVWVLHPYLTSTTLYVIQRMAMLSALFCLLGIYLYLKGRQLFLEVPSRGIMLMCLGVGLGTFLPYSRKKMVPFSQCLF